MESLKLNVERVFDFVSRASVNLYKHDTLRQNYALHNKTGKGNDFLGWVNLPSSITETDIINIENTVNKLKSKINILVVVGIGGSYLGAKSVIDALSDSFEFLKRKHDNPLILYAGQNISEDYMVELRSVLKEYDYAICVISKSGTTTEPAIAFRILKQDIEQKYGKKDAAERIIAVTDKHKGALKQLADQEGYQTFVIPDDVGGRYSVLTPVGLIPIAFAGFDIRKLIEGALSMEKITGVEQIFEENPAAIYAAVRNALYKQGYEIEILANFHPKMHFIAEWWKQLYGESEGKEHKGIFTASVDFTTDLHSLGQYIQDGQRNLFETVISVKNTKYELSVPKDDADLDKLNFLAGKRIDQVNKNAELGTMLAHIEGGVPNIRLEIPELNEFYLGQLIYFFEKACGISGYLLDVNPFDQPGVEAYKVNMFALLGKPGYEKEAKKLQEKLDA